MQMETFTLNRFAVTLTICLFTSVMFAAGSPAATHDMAMKASDRFDREEALAVSRAAIGRAVGDGTFQDTHGNRVTLAALRGKPLVVSLIYTSCYHICPTTTRHLADVVDKARSALGEDSFNVATIGFDTMRDTPPMMADFARAQGVDDDNWYFLSGDRQGIERLSEELGFLYFPSANGFDHLVQTTVIDATGEVYQQVYGLAFDTPLLVEPLKRLVFGATESAGLLQSVSNQVRLFCTVYDPSADKYKFDYSIFIGTFIGIMCVGLLGVVLVREWRKTLSAKA